MENGNLFRGSGPTGPQGYGAVCATGEGSEGMAEDTTYDLIAATGCPTGIAHTYMAKEALEKAAAAKGLTIKVETHGQVGIENEVTPAQIKAAKAVIVAADKDVQAERFADKPMVSVGVTAAIKDAEGLIDKALAAKAQGELSEEVANASSDNSSSDEKESVATSSTST